MVIQEKFVSAADLWELSHDPANEGKRFELSEGVLIEMSPAGGKRGIIAMRFGNFILNYVDTYHPGHVTAAETGYTLYRNPNGRDTVRAPDVGFVAAERLPEGVPDGYIPLAPDLAVEVISPNDSADEVQAKLNDYLRFGVRMIVLVYPKSKTVTVYVGGSARVLSIEDTLDGGDVLPGFTLALKDLFK